MLFSKKNHKKHLAWCKNNTEAFESKYSIQVLWRLMWNDCFTHNSRTLQRMLIVQWHIVAYFFCFWVCTSIEVGWDYISIRRFAVFKDLFIVMRSRFYYARLRKFLCSFSFPFRCSSLLHSLFIIQRLIQTDV